MNLNELKKQSLSDENFISQIVYKIKNPDTRSDFFKVISSIGSHWQENPTPLDIIHNMVGKTSLDNKKILVLFNIEFLQVLIEEKNIKPENIYYVADNKLEYLCGSKIFKVQSYHLKEHNVASLKQQITGLNMKFDLVFSNPPYNKSIDIKILTEVYDVADEMIVIHPSTWLLDTKGSYSTYNNFRNKINRHIQSFSLFNGNADFGITVNTPIVISHINKNLDADINVDFFGEIYSAPDISDVTKFGKSWFLFVKKFMKEIVKECSNSGSIWSNRVDANNIDESKFYCQLADIIGNVNLTSKTSQMVKDDFYTMTIKNSKDNIGIRKNTIQNTYMFNTEKERDNFLKYCETDFARFCVALTKNNTHIDSGEMKNVPWLDFTEEWDDEKLFKKFNVSQELQDYIREFLPDYYGIRK